MIWAWTLQDWYEKWILHGFIGESDARGSSDKAKAGRAEVVEGGGGGGDKYMIYEILYEVVNKAKCYYKKIGNIKHCFWKKTDQFW